VRLIVEVADTSLADDLGDKRASYAKAGLLEYWVANLNGKVMHRHHAPNGQAYWAADLTSFGAPAAGLTLPITVETAALR
jgi:Putative restriction endonuclease